MDGFAHAIILDFKARFIFEDVINIEAVKRVFRQQAIAINGRDPIFTVQPFKLIIHINRSLAMPDDQVIDVIMVSNFAVLQAE